MPAKKHKPKLLSFAQVAKSLQISQDAVQWLIDTNQLIPVKLCGNNKIIASDLDDLLRTYKEVQSKGRPNGK